MAKEPTSIITALTEQPLDMALVDSDSNLGGEIGLQDIAIPYCYVLQGNSPQVNPDHAKYISDAKAGMIYLTNLEKVYEGRDAGLDIIPCYYQRLVTEWLPRESGGGLVASHEPGSTAVEAGKLDDRGRLFLANGHQLIDTAYHYWLVQDPSTMTWYQVIAPFKSTALKVSRRMNSTISTNVIPGTHKRAPRFLYKWHLTTVKEQKDQYVWSSPRLEQTTIVSAEAYAAARAYALVAAKGLLRRVATEVEQEAVTKSVADNHIDDDIPF